MSDPDAYQHMVTTNHLKDYMSGLGLDADQAGASQDILDGLVRELERYCQKPLERKERTETLQPDEFGRLWPTATPIVSVSVPDPTDSGLIIMPGHWIYGLAFYGGYGAYPYATVELTYIGGIDGPNEADVRLAVLRIAAREVDARHDDTLSVSDLETSRPKPDPVKIGWQPDELAKFDRLRRRTIV